LSTLKRFFKDTIIYGLAAVLPRVVTILLVKLKTKVFASETFAVDVTYYIYAAYLNVLLTYGMETAFFRFFTKEKDKGKIISTTFISLVVTTLLFLVLSLYFSETLSLYFGFSNPLFFKLLIATLFLDTLVVIPYAYLRVTNRPIRFAFFKVGNVIIYAFFVVFFLWIAPHFEISLPSILTDNFGETPQVIYVFFAGVIASLITFIMMLPIALKFKLTFDKHILKKLLAYGLPIMIGGLAYATNENLDKLLLPNYIGKSEMGIYAACYKLGVFMTLFITAFRMGAEPFFFNHADKKNAKTSYATILTWFTIIGAIFMFVIVAYIQLFAKIIISQDEYLQALSIVPIILLANLILGIYNNLSIWYKLTDQTKYGMYISVFGALITIILNLLFIPRFGYMASAWATLAVYSSMTLVSYYLGKKHYPVPYQINKVILYIVISILFSVISFYKFQENYYISTLLLVAFIGIIFILEKNTIRQLRLK
jgi:O-antigen/teichoic acid export membrane protein